MVSNTGLAMTILPNENVGIGVTGPTEKLHVDGNIAINDRIIGNSKNYATSQGWLPGAAGSLPPRQLVGIGARIARQRRALPGRDAGHAAGRAAAGRRRARAALQ